MAKCTRNIRKSLIVGIAAALFTTTLCAQESEPVDDSAPNAADSETAATETAAGRSMNATMRRDLSNVPDNVADLIRQSEREADALLPFGPLAPLHHAWQRANQHLHEAAGLDLGLDYTTVYQRADTTVSGPRDALGGDLDFFGRWLLAGCEDHWPGALVFNSETRHRYTAIPPASLDTGTAGGTITSFNTQDFTLVELYWEQGSADDGAIYRAGEMDPALIYDGGRYVSSNYAFFSPAFSDTLPMALPGAGLGFAGAVYPTDSTYLVAGMHDANGRRTTAGFDTFFGEGEYFTALEIGWFPDEGQPSEGLYHVTFWQIDARQAAGRPSDRGVAVTLEQQFGCRGNLVPFLRYAYADRGLNGIRQNLSIGVGIEEFFGQNYDLVGLAASWEQTSDDTLRDQYVLEAFYRIVITPYTHLTPGVQVVIDPANAPGKDAVTVFGMRLRTLF